MKIIKMYGKGMSISDISNIVEGIYGFSLDLTIVSKIIDAILRDIELFKTKN